MANDILEYDDNNYRVAGAVDDVSGEIRNLKSDSNGYILAEITGIVNDYKVAVTTNDTTPDYLSSKIVDSATVTWTVNNPGSNETYSASVVPGGSAFYQTIQEDGVALTQRAISNFTTYFNVTDNVTKTNITLDIAAIEPALDLANIGGLLDLSTQVTGLLASTNIDITNLESTLDLANIAGAIDLSTQVTGLLDATNIDITSLETALDLGNISGQIDLATQVTGVLPAANGGDAFTVKATGTDTTPDFLDDKIEIVSSDLSVTINKTISSGNEKISYDLSTSALTDKLVGAGGISNKVYYNIQVLFDTYSWSTNGFNSNLLTSIFAPLSGGDGRAVSDAFALPNFDSTVAVRQYSTQKETIMEFFATMDNGSQAEVFLGITTGTPLSKYNNNTVSVGFVTDSAGGYYIKAATGSARTVTSITAPASGVHLYRIEYDPANTEARFYIDGTSVGTITTNLPTAINIDMAILLGNTEIGGEQFKQVSAPSFAIEI